ncbi:zinc finger protein [Histomonas meleagridis]|uniref:zinc finger protein n=1 Tax=Histomonas meleagridis TaxID=135588 RepID=UPI003559C5E7|nr:zinc finger protein [Histomonas meleagridis]
MVEHEKEREEKSEMKCLFCNENFRGTWHEYLQWEFEEHQFNPGRPSNLIFIPELIALLRKQLDSNICICCGAQFPNQRTLRSHLRKKRHLRIPNDPSFDRYYMVNYLELNGRAPIDDEDDDLNAEMQPLEIAAADFNEIEVNETYCLICDNVFRNPEDAVRHMRQAHHFDLNDVRKLLKWDFYNCVRFVNFARYSKSRNHCFVCNGEVDSDYVKHIESHKDKCPMDLKKFVGEDQLLIPFIDGDPLLTVLEDNVE